MPEGPETHRQADRLARVLAGQRADTSRFLVPDLLEAEAPGVQHSNLGGWQSSWDLEAWGGPAVARVLDAARSLATRLTADRHGNAVEIDWQVKKALES